MWDLKKWKVESFTEEEIMSNKRIGKILEKIVKVTYNRICTSVGDRGEKSSEMEIVFKDMEHA